MTPLNDALPKDPRARYQQYKASAKERLKLQRACSELIWDTAQDMLLAIRTGDWINDLSLSERKNPSRDQWASKVLGMSPRQARKYFAVAECLTREQVAGTGLCLDRMYQVALGWA